MLRSTSHLSLPLPPPSLLSSAILPSTHLQADYPDFFEIDGEEEPLFADDLDDIDDDIPPLPPPMPSLSQLSDSRVAQFRVNSNSQENFGGGTTGGYGTG